MRIMDWSSEVCTSDLVGAVKFVLNQGYGLGQACRGPSGIEHRSRRLLGSHGDFRSPRQRQMSRIARGFRFATQFCRITQRNIQLPRDLCRSEEHTSELQSLMRISYAVFCLKKKTYKPN